jgi:hypothetical protein
MHRRGRTLLAPVVVAVALAAGCGDDDTGTTGDAATTAVVVPADLPPLEEYSVADIENLRAVYGPPLAAFDLEVTRGGLVDLNGGNHLQIYAEPTTPASANGPQVFLDRMLPSFQAIVPLLFDAYPDLDSFDLCQEPVPDESPSTTQPEYEEPVTLLFLTRAAYESVPDWDTATLADLLAVAPPGEDFAAPGLSKVIPAIAALPDYQAAAAD